MASFMFIGDPRGYESPPAVEIYGLVFPKGMAVEVTDAMAIAKLNGNGHFRRCDAEQAAPRKARSRGKEKETGGDDAREG